MDESHNPHAIRNWLHQFLLAVQATDPEGIDDCLTTPHDFLFETAEGARWERWQPWLATLTAALEGEKRPATVALKLIGRPELLPPTESGQRRVGWRMRLSHPSVPPISPGRYQGSALLVHREARWLARSIRLAPLPPDGDRIE